MFRPSLRPRPFRTVVVATDLSTGGARAVDRAMRLRLAPDATVHLLHVVEGVSGGSAPPAGALRAVEAAARDAAATARAEGHASVEVVPVLAMGDVATEVALHARLVGAGLVVVGRRGTRVAGARRGATTRALMEAAGVPILMSSNDPVEPYRRPIVAADLDLSSVDLLLLALRVAGESARQVTVLHVHDVGFEGTRGFRGATLTAWGLRFRRAAERRLAEILGTVPGCGVEWRPAVRHGDPGREVVEGARIADADLVVIGTHARRGLDRLMLGSVSAEVLRDARCDVLVARPTQAVRAFPPRRSNGSHSEVRR